MQGIDPTAVSVNWIRWIAGVESLIHVPLISPDGGEAATHTLRHEHGHWTVLPGLHRDEARGVRHKPGAEHECHIMLIERKSALHTGSTVADKTRSLAEQLQPV